MTEASHNHYSKFLLIWAGEFLSVIGTGLTMFALGVYVYQRTQSTSSYVLILLCVFLPPFLLKPYGGVLADRYDRRLMMILGDSGASLGLIFIFVMMVTGRIELWHIYLGIAMSSVFTAFQEPAYKALVTDLLPEEQYAKASGLMQLANSAQYLISPFLAGILLTLMRVEYIFLLDISTLFLASGIIIWIRKTLGGTAPQPSQHHFLADLKEGVQAFSTHRGVVHLVLTIMLVLFFVGLLQSLLVPMLLNLTTPKIVGISQSLCASGMILGSLVIGVFGGKQKHVVTLALSLFLAGLFFAGIGLSTQIIAVTATGFLFFATLPFINTSIEVLIRKNIDNRKQGRVWSIISTITYLGSIIAFAVAGFLADHIFNPLLAADGLLADTVGRVIGVGAGRGIALLFLISGGMISVIAVVIWRNTTIKRLEAVEGQGQTIVQTVA
ncbi:MFS transporter [candidate division KSB3 bacterium]|uniref:MFS transporter n=1 Tax=candidate division KSB3 bacterium TaxID=2044937 RepID=A0A9D5JXC6_9BACT|nr:MFS transporter [candidate division KSB3 bacterium]MBD3325855.1 MFS transporter [candidate division KSB3 bacterium]